LGKDVGIEPEDQQAAEKAPLFRENTENKIGGLLRYIAVVTLRSLQKAQTVSAARTDCRHRLEDIPPGSARIDIRIQENNEPLHLIVFQYPASG